MTAKPGSAPQKWQKTAGTLAATVLLAVSVVTILNRLNIDLLQAALPWMTLVGIALIAIGVGPWGRMFIAVAAILSALVLLILPDGLALIIRGLNSAAFIGTFFIALSTLKIVAETSPTMEKAGLFLASQPPGRRYAALTLGSHMFSVILNYGSIALLGGLATTSANSEPDPSIRKARTRRMLLAIQRGFVACLPWSPLGICMALTNALIPGARWADSLWPGLTTAAVMMGTGWLLDRLFEPRSRVQAAPAVQSAQTWNVLFPLIGLLVGLALAVLLIHMQTGLEVVAIVMLIVPILSLAWALLQRKDGDPALAIPARARRFVTRDIPGNRGELVLLTMAGYIGTLGAPLLDPLLRGAGFDAAQLPAWVILTAFIWIIPLLGQLAMNPILAVTLIAPLIPDSAALGVAPDAIVTAIAAGWALSSSWSQFTANNQLLGVFGNVSALRVGLVWNGPFVALTGSLLTAWVLTYALAIRPLIAG